MTQKDPFEPDIVARALAKNRLGVPSVVFFGVAVTSRRKASTSASASIASDNQAEILIQLEDFVRIGGGEGDIVGSPGEFADGIGTVRGIAARVILQLEDHDVAHSSFMQLAPRGQARNSAADNHHVMPLEFGGWRKIAFAQSVTTRR